MKKNKLPKKKIKNKTFPVGFFILLFFIQAILTTASLTVYFTHSGKRITSEIEQYTKNYSITMAEAVSDTAELSYDLKQYTALTDLLNNRIRQNIADEAFFVLNNGAIIAHSKKGAAESLKGNIGNDEFAYNIDLILSRSWQNSRDVLFCDYNFIDKTIPFEMRELKLLKTYIYSGIDSTGWLASKAVFLKDKSIGTVNFIISKERIYNPISELINSVKQYWIYGMAGSFTIALLVSIFIFLRYRSIQKKNTRLTSDEIIRDADDIPLDSWDYEYPEDEISSYSVLTDDNDISEDDGENENIIIDISEPDLDLDLDMSELHTINDLSPSEPSKIRDAVPVREILKK